jgi:hypothetical protein
VRTLLERLKTAKGSIEREKKRGRTEEREVKQEDKEQLGPVVVRRSLVERKFAVSDWLDVSGALKT